MMEAKMKAARMKLQARQQACLQRAMVEWRAIRNKSQSRIARRRTALSMHSPHVHSPCAQPLDDGWLLHVKMLHLLAGFEGECKAAHRVRRGSWRRVLAGVVFSLASCKSALAARSLVRGFFSACRQAMSLEFSLGPRSFVASYHRKRIAV